MYEIRRILCSRKVLITLMVLLSINAAVFFYEHIPGEEYGYYSENYLDNYNKLFGELIERYASVDLSEGYNEAVIEYNSLLKELSDGGQVEDYRIEAWGKIVERLGYIANYGQKYQAVTDNANALLKSVNFSQEESFSVRNINKTVNDYEGIQNIQLSLEDETGMSELLLFDFTDYLLIIFILVIVLSIYEERKKGIWNYVYAAQEGRKKSAVYKVCGISIGALAASLLLYIENIICAIVRFGGVGDLSRAAQSNEYFENLTMELSIGTALIVILTFKILAVILFGIIFWLIISNISSPVLGFLIYGIIVFAEYYTYFELSPYSVWRNIKYINLFGIMDGRTMLGTYMNLNIFGYAVNRISVICIMTVVLLIITMAVFIILGKRKPFVAKKRQWLKSGFYRHCSMFLHEIYKIFICQKIWLIIILFGSVMYSVTRPVEMFFEYDTTIYNQYMTSLAGPVTEEKAQYLEKEIVLWENQIMECQDQLEQSFMGETEVSQNEIERIEKKIRNLETAKDVAEKIYEDGEKMLVLKDEGYDVEFVNEIGYDMLLGTGSIIKNNQDAILLLAFMVLTISTMWSYDNQCDMSRSIKAMVNGRRKYCMMKNVIAAILIIVAILIQFWLRFNKIQVEYGLSGLDASIKSLPYFRNFGLDINVGAFMGFFLLARFIAAFTVALIIMFISSKSKNNVFAIAINAVVMLLPACVFYLGIEGIKYISAISCISVASLWKKGSIVNSGFVIPEIIIIVLGVTIGIYHMYEDRIKIHIREVKLYGKKQ